MKVIVKVIMITIVIVHRLLIILLSQRVELDQ